MKEFFIKTWLHVCRFGTHRFILVSKINYEDIDQETRITFTFKTKKVYVCEKCGKVKIKKDHSEFIDNWK